MTIQLERERTRPPGTALGARPRVEFPLSHLVIHCVIGAAMWAGIIALVAGAASCAVGRAIA